MAKYVNEEGVKHLWQAAENTFLKAADAGETYTIEEKNKLAALENYELPAATANDIGGVKVGEGLVVDESGTISVVPAEIPSVDWENVDNAPNTLAGYGITDAASKTDLDALFDELEGHYVYRGQVATMDDLAAIENPKGGDVYDVESSGANYAYNAAEDRWDCLGGAGTTEALTLHEIDVITGDAASEATLLAMIQEGGSVVLDSDVTLTRSACFTEDATVNMRDHKIIAETGDDYTFVIDGANVTLKSGTIEATGSLFHIINGGTLTIESGVYTAEGRGIVVNGEESGFTFEGGNIEAVKEALVVEDGATVNMNAGGLTSFSAPVITTASREGVTAINKINIYGGSIIAKMSEEGFASCGVLLAHRDRFVLDGGEIVSMNGCGIVIRDGRAYLKSGSITAYGGSYSGWVGSNGTKMSCSAIIYHESANEATYGMRLEVTGGTYQGANLALEKLTKNKYPNILIAGGTFTPAL